MSEYWVSHKKYRCTYCDIFISDDAPSRQQHENGLRHKGNKERFVKNLYKQGERQKKEKEDERREMAVIEKAANAAYLMDVSRGAGSTSALPSPTPAAAPSRPKPPSAPSNPYANYSTAESLGFTDPDLERQLLEAQLHQSEGTVGEWTVVTPAYPTAPTEAAATAAQKRPRQAGADGAEEVEEGRAFKVRKRTTTVGLGELWDPGVVKVKVKEPPKEEPKDAAAEKEVAKEEPGEQTRVKEEDTGNGMMKPKWVASTWNTVGAKAEEDRIKEEAKVQELRFGTKEEPKEDAPPPDPPTHAGAQQAGVPTEPEPAPLSGAGLFKKRKGPPAGAKVGRPRP